VFLGCDLFQFFVIAGRCLSVFLAIAIDHSPPLAWPIGTLYFASIPSPPKEGGCRTTSLREEEGRPENERLGKRGGKKGSKQESKHDAVESLDDRVPAWIPAVTATLTDFALYSSI
jgi:hypothetical protein